MSIAALDADYLFVGQRIIERLREQLPQDAAVEGIEAMSQALDAQDLRAYVAYVMWGGELVSVTEGGRAGASQKIVQRWIMWLRVRNAAIVDKAARNSAAGPWLSLIHRALHTWQPEDAFTKLLRVQGPAPNYQATSGLYPLAFDINLAL